MGWLGRRVKKSGIALAILLALTTIILILGTAAAAMIAHLSQQVASAQRASQAKYAARAGLSRALLELSKDPLWGPASLVLPDGDAESFPFRDTALGCTVEAVNNWNGSGSVATPEGTALEPGRVWLRSTGTFDGEPLSGAHGVAAALAVKPDVVFNLAVNQREGVLAVGAESVLIASYRSTSAPLDPKDPTPALAGQAVLRAEQGVTMTPASQLQGRVQVPRVDTEVSAHLRDRVDVVPDGPLPLQFSEPDAFRAQPHPSESGAILNLPPGPYLNVDVSPGGRLTLHGGTYYIDSLTLAEGAILELQGATGATPCVVYLGEIFDVGQGSEINWNGPPAFLQLYSTDRDNWGVDQFILGADTRSSFVIAGDVLELTLRERAVLYGAVDARLVTWGPSSQLLFDENLIGQVLEGDPEWVLVSETD